MDVIYNFEPWCWMFFALILIGFDYFELPWIGSFFALANIHFGFFGMSLNCLFHWYTHTYIKLLAYACDLCSMQLSMEYVFTTHLSWPEKRKLKSRSKNVLFSFFVWLILVCCICFGMKFISIFEINKDYTGRIRAYPCAVGVRHSKVF